MKKEEKNLITASHDNDIISISDRKGRKIELGIKNGELRGLINTLAILIERERIDYNYNSLGEKILSPLPLIKSTLE